jgi:ribosomal protein S8
MKGNKLKHSFYESEDVCYEQTELPSRTNIESVSVSNTITNVMVALHPMSIEYTKREMLKTLCNYLYENGFIESTQQRDDFHNNIILELKIKAKKI